ncbi:MAG: hypothetical protein F6K54_07285 [Okeania sp. SIO3B5]|uniref:hypothetical protein n=1 Tax=Okeania sp. SIO3B5 TaxID=2607811 RepID=UPI001400D4B6|nr:hypothetical protein [Okeania sp. SIO3B5]NEO52898.1 hypothetical protein [Okeania sp. SIO3B5]
MTDIINSTIDLFLYDLINSLGDDEKDIEQKRQYFYQKFHTDIREKLEQDRKDNNQNLEVEYLHLLKSIYAPLDSDTSIENGYYYPVRLGDSYGLLLEVAVPDKKTPEYFAELREKIQQKLGENIATLGQTWMLSTYLPNSSEKTPEEIEKIAQECYKAIFPNAEEIEFDSKGEFIGAGIFEYSDKSLKQEIVKLEDQEIFTVVQIQHIIIAIYPDQETFQKLGEFYTDWMHLFYYHHKIIWAYGQSRILTSQTKEKFREIQTITESIEENITQENAKINKLQKISDILSKVQVIIKQYTSNLNNLKFQQGAIEINLNNYDKRLQTITKKATKKVVYNQTNINFLENFSQLVEEKYLLQITKDLESFELGLRLLEDNINAIHTQIETEKAKSDRDFQEFIAVVGSGVAFASLAGFNVIAECKSMFTNKFFLCQNTLLYKFILVIIGSLLAWFVRRYILKRP